jgi:integrase/recombinase XerD
MQLLGEYIDHIEENKLFSFNSIRLYKRDLMDFYTFCVNKLGTNFLITSLDSEILNRFIKYISDQGRSTAAVNRKLTALHNFWTWLREKGMVSRDPFTQIRRESQFRNKTFAFLSEDEIVVLLDCAEHDLKTKMILELIYATGIRVGELVQLTVTDIDLDSQLITIPRSARFKERVIPFNELLASYMEEHIKISKLGKNSKLLLNRRNEGVSEREIFRLIREAAKKAGLNKTVSPSILRNSFLKHMKENGAHETLLRDLTGQKTVKMIV